MCLPDGQLNMRDPTEVFLNILVWESRLMLAMPLTPTNQMNFTTEDWENDSCWTADVWCLLNRKFGLETV